jgi:cell division protease FtsH
MQNRTRFSLSYYIILFAGIFFIDSFLFSGPSVKDIPYNEFIDRVTADKVESVVLTKEQITGLMKKPQPDGSEKAKVVKPPAKHTPWRLDWESLTGWFQGYDKKAEEAKKAAEEERKRHFTVIPVENPQLVSTLQTHGVEFKAELHSEWLSNFFWNWIIPFGLLFLVWGWIMRRMGKGGPNMLNIGQNKAKVYEADPNNKTTFQDIAGVDEAMEETLEVVSFLKEPEKYTQLGAKLPKGVLLVGPPGTGKTLLAKAIAGEAGVPFFSLSGSDFVEMFVGVGASRVRDLFSAAKQKAPCIIFIDEMDAIGKSRAQAGFSAGGFDERENTLNQLLVEMDGFDGRTAVVLMGATNRPEVLDRALLRPGRFDREILVDRPTREGRLAIFKVHSRGLPLAADVDLDTMAAQTPGFVGADIANLCNEAALLATRRNHQDIKMADFQDAIERIIGGLEKKGQVLNEKDRRTVAYHESGHTLVGYFTPGADPVQKVSIVPRGRGALGYTLQSPAEDHYLMSHSELLGRVRTLLGGRASEEIVFGEVSTGASDDLEKASKITRDMLTVYGMSQKIPNLSLVDPNQQQGFLGQGSQIVSHSGEIEQAIGEEQLEILRTCYEEAKTMISERRDRLEAMAERLLKQEKLDRNDLVEILGPRPL